MSDVAGVIEFNAKPGRGAEVARLIADALPHVEAETGTPLWLVIRSKADPEAVFLVDLFTNDAALDAHMTGKAAEQIFRTVPPLLSGDPKIHPAEVIARKGA